MQKEKEWTWATCLTEDHEDGRWKRGGSQKASHPPSCRSSAARPQRLSRASKTPPEQPLPGHHDRPSRHTKTRAKTIPGTPSQPQKHEFACSARAGRTARQLGPPPHRGPPSPASQHPCQGGRPTRFLCAPAASGTGHCTRHDNGHDSGQGEVPVAAGG